MKLYIHTLGDFDISFGGQSVLKESSRSYKLIRLLEYFITFRGRKLLPETIIENLWQEKESNDPKNVLRTQIFRLRQIMKKSMSGDMDIAKYFNIGFSNGYYIFEPGELAVLDMVEFENLIDQGDSRRTDNLDEAVDLYCKAVKLYKGPYLSENSYEAWLVPIRNHYGRLYLKALFRLMEILKEKEEYVRIIELCEEAIIIEPYEEALHIYLIEAMLKTGQIRNAMSHYDYIASLLNKEMGVKSSPGLKDIYRKIQSYYDEKSESGIESIRNKLEERTLEGALLCDADYFKFLFNIGKRKSFRSDTSEHLGLITLNCAANSIKGEEELKRLVKHMSEVLEKNLRKDDVYCFWNDNQILVMLHGAKDEYLNRIEKRIRDNFISAAITGDCRINIEFASLASKKDIV